MSEHLTSVIIKIEEETNKGTYNKTFTSYASAFDYLKEKMNLERKYRIITAEEVELVVSCEEWKALTNCHCFYSYSGELLLCTPIGSTVMLICDEIERMV